MVGFAKPTRGGFPRPSRLRPVGFDQLRMLVQGAAALVRRVGNQSNHDVRNAERVR